MAGEPATFRFSTVKLKRGIRECLQRDARLANAAMRDVSMYLIRQARDRAPKRTGMLANSITGGVFPYRKSFAAVVYVPVNSPAKDYAIPMHENDYELGENSLAKQDKVGVQVGRRYLTRAVTENSDTIIRMITDRCKK